MFLISCVAAALLLAADPAPTGYEQAADYSAGLGGRAVLVVHKGKTVFERYDNGWSAERAHPLASGTKSFSGILAACAVQDALFSSFDELASDTLTEWKTDPKKSKITVRHLLTLSSGLDMAEEQLDTPRTGMLTRDSDLPKQEHKGSDPARDKFAFAATVPSKHEPGTRFEYGSVHFYAFGELLERKIKAKKAADPAFPYATFTDYMLKRLVEPAGIRVARWGKDRTGNLNLPGGLQLTAREWGKFGALILNRGSTTDAAGKPSTIVDATLLAECFKPSPANPAYGLTWWLPSQGDAEVADTGGVPPEPRGGSPGPSAQPTAEPPADPAQRARFRNQLRETRAIKGPDGENLEVYMAAGLGKQRLYVIPRYDLVVVRFSEASRKGNTFSNEKFLGPIVQEAAKNAGDGKGR